MPTSRSWPRPPASSRPRRWRAACSVSSTGIGAITGEGVQRLAALIVHAPNIHIGGGAELLSALLKALDEAPDPSIAVLDERFAPTISARRTRVIAVRPSLAGRLAAERKLGALATPTTRVLCFGNLPPLFRLRAKVYLYLQNRNLLRDSSAFANGQWYTGMRECAESAWLRLRIGNVDEIVVQSQSMRALVAERFHREALVAPFVPERKSPGARAHAGQTAFLYVASGDAHKNHLRLVEAWELLARAELKPALWLTLDRARFAPLVRSIEARAAAAGLEVRNFGHLPRAELSALYDQATALIYPSLGESYGLPLIEASAAGLPIVAAELDYVREIVDPRETFDPQSALSIARAVRRFLGRPEARRPQADAHAFLQRIMAD